MATHETRFDVCDTIFTVRRDGSPKYEVFSSKPERIMLSVERNGPTVVAYYFRLENSPLWIEIHQEECFGTIEGAEVEVKRLNDA